MTVYAQDLPELREKEKQLAKDKSIEVDGYSGFAFIAKSGRPLMPNGVNSVLYNIVDAYNKTEVEKAKKSIGKRSCYQSFQFM